MSGPEKKRNQLVYDLPTRIFHWTFTALFIIAFYIAKTIDDEAAAFAYHMLAGLTLGFLVLLRVIWGFMGTKHARFTGFALKPTDVLGYFKGILTGNTKRWAGHNPASSWAGLGMMAMALGLAITGTLMTSGTSKEDFEDIHELLANGFLVLALMHVAGVILHTIRHHDGVGMSMVDGRKQDVPGTEVISTSRPAAGILLVILLASFAFALSRGYNAQNGTLNFFGTTLQLGETERGEGGDGSAQEKHDESKEPDDD